MKTTIDTNTPDQPVIVMTRTLDAPRDLVWAAFTDPKHVVRWFGGKGFQGIRCEMDVRPGGQWLHVWRLPDGFELEMHSVFVEVSKPERLVWKDANYDRGSNMQRPPSHKTVTLEEFGQQTKWKLVTRFHTLAERDATARTEFANVIADGTEILDEMLRTGAFEEKHG